ncbi:MAG: glycosyltransferase [Candidatus Paceibacterota bacterium]|jgi:glycosyltransferase involved in cell wall biosynthesis
MENKKIVFIWNNLLIGGTEQVLLEILKNLDKSRFKANIILILGSGSMESEFKKLEFPIFFAGPKKYFSSLLFKVIWILSLPFIFLRIMVFLEKINPDVVITSLYQADILGIFAAWLCGVKRRIIIHHDVVRINPIIRWLKIKALQKANKIIAISDEVKIFLIEYFKVSASKIEVIYNAIDFEKFLCFQKSDNDWEPVFGIVARLNKIKGHIYILEALKKIKNEGVKLPAFIFVGDGPERKNLEIFAEENDLTNIKFVGETLEIGEYLKQMDVFVLPSLSEGLGVSLIEALVAKKLIIASNIGGIKELIKHNKTGILVEPANSDDLYKAIKWVLENKNEALKLRTASFEWINKNRHLFDTRDVSKNIANIYVNN